MTRHTFTLRYRLPRDMTCGEAVEQLSKSECTYMLFGVGVPGHLSACASIDTLKPEQVERFARLLIERAIPAIAFIEALPGFVVEDRPAARRKGKSILDMAGMLTAPEGKHVSIEDMNLFKDKP